MGFLPVTSSFILYDLNGNGVVDADDVQVLTDYVGGPPPTGIPLCRATMGSAISNDDVVAAQAIVDQIALPTVVIWLTKSTTDAIRVPAEAIVSSGSFEIFIRSEVDGVVLWTFPNALSAITSVGLLLLDNTNVETISSFVGDQGINFYSNKIAKDIHAQFRIEAGWRKLHVEAAVGWNLLSVYYQSLAVVSPDQGSYNFDLANGETRTLVLQRGTTTLTLPVAVDETSREYKFNIVPFYRGLKQLDFGNFSNPFGPSAALPPQTTTPEFDLSVTRPQNQAHTRALSLCGSFPASPTVIEDELAALNDEISTVICPSGRTSNFKCSDPTLMGISFATLTETENADLIADFNDTVRLAGVFTSILTKWYDFSHFQEKFNFFLYREDSPDLAFLNLSELGHATYRVYINLTKLESFPVENWESLLGPIPIWASFLHKWAQTQTDNLAPVPEDLALAIAYEISSSQFNWSPYYFGEIDLGKTLKVHPWLSMVTMSGAETAEKLEATIDFLMNIYGDTIPDDVPGTISDAITEIPDTSIESVTAQFVELMELYGVTVTPPSTNDPIVLRNWLLDELPGNYTSVIIPDSESSIDYINDRIEHGGSSITASFLCGEAAPTNDLVILADFSQILEKAISIYGAARLLRLWSWTSPSSGIADLLGSNLCSVLIQKATERITAKDPAVEQTQIVESYRVTRHRLVAASFLLPIEYTTKILAWPDPESAEAIADLPSTNYDLFPGSATLAQLVDPYTSYQPDPPVLGVPGEIAVAGSEATFKSVVLAGTSAFVLSVDREILLVVSRTS